MILVLIAFAAVLFAVVSTAVMLPAVLSVNREIKAEVAHCREIAERIKARDAMEWKP